MTITFTQNDPDYRLDAPEFMEGFVVRNMRTYSAEFDGDNMLSEKATSLLEVQAEDLGNDTYRLPNGSTFNVVKSSETLENGSVVTRLDFLEGASKFKIGDIVSTVSNFGMPTRIFRVTDITADFGSYYYSDAINSENAKVGAAEDNLKLADKESAQKAIEGAQKNLTDATTILQNTQELAKLV